MPHIHDLYDFTISAFIVHDSKVLLVNHPRYGKWLPIGGHIELDEDPEQALYREITEESGLTGFTVLSTKPAETWPGHKFILSPAYVDVHEANAPHKHIGLIYFVVAKNNQSTLSAEHTDMRWFGADELDNPQYNVSDSAKFYARKAIGRALA